MPDSPSLPSAARWDPAGALSAQIIAHLSRSDAYRGNAEDVNVLQTRLSVLFLVGRRAYKLRKSERVAGDIAERRRQCEEDLRLNRRIAPKMFLGIRAVTRERDGRLVVDGDGEEVDWLVEMVRLPEEGKLDALLDREELDRAQIDKLAAVLARFHQRALTGPDVNRYGLPFVVEDRFRENLDELSDAATRHSRLVPAAALAFLARELNRFLQARRRMMERRVGDWRIREGHGNLSLGNVCILRGEVFVYGGVQPDRRLRCGDVAFDLALLAMELDHRGHAAAARRLVARYAELTSDDDLAELVEFYKVQRALERAKALLLGAEDPDLTEAPLRAGPLDAAGYTQLAVAYRLPACLVLVGGSGDSHSPSPTADHVAGRMRATLLRDDEDERSNVVECAAAHLEREDPVVVQAASILRDDQRPYVDTARQLGVPLFAVQLDGGESPSGVPASRIVRLPADVGPEEVGVALQERMIAAFG